MLLKIPNQMWNYKQQQKQTSTICQDEQSYSDKALS